MQKVINVEYNGYSLKPLEEVNKMLEDGWKVVMMQPFSQVVSVPDSVGHIASQNMQGAYGMTFVLEKAMYA